MYAFQSSFPRIPAWALALGVMLGLGLLAWLLDFNGLYGQDAHEYLRLCGEIRGNLRGEGAMLSEAGKSQVAIGYPFWGALISLTGLSPLPALQGLSLIGAGLAVWFFNGCLREILPGARLKSHFFYPILMLALAPAMVRGGITVMTDITAVALMLGSVWLVLRNLENINPWEAVLSALLAGMAVATRYGYWVLLSPFMVLLAVRLLHRRLWMPIPLLILAGLAGMLPVWLYRPPGLIMDGYGLLEEWSPLNFFRRSFNFGSGNLSYRLPNLLYAAGAIYHPAFCVFTPLLLLLSKKTDWWLPARQIILVSLGVYLLFIAGLPQQNLRFLLPMYVLGLVLLFPAWDRMISYGFFFLKKKWMWLILGIILMAQLAFGIYHLRTVLSLNRLEQEIAEDLRTKVPAGCTLYGFDIDLAMKTYLPDLQHQGLYDRRISEFETGAYILFNEPAFAEKWKHQNPMLNWTNLKNRYPLDTVSRLPEGWTLYRIGNPPKQIGN